LPPAARASICAGLVYKPSRLVIKPPVQMNVGKMGAAWERSIAIGGTSRQYAQPAGRRARAARQRSRIREHVQRQVGEPSG
jgi:hypothetical protein